MSFPKKGNIFPEGETNAQYGATIARALRYELGNTHQAVKTVVRWTNANERTVKNWLAGTSGPSGTHLISLMRNSVTVFEAMLHLAGREQALVTCRLVETRERMWETIQLIDHSLQIEKEGRQDGV